MDPSSSIELKIMHGKDLSAFNFFQKLQVYVLVSIISDDPDQIELKKKEQQQPQRTPADTEGDANPEWKHEMRFHLTEEVLCHQDHIFILFDLRHEGLYFGDKIIGEVRVPLKDLIQQSYGGIVRFVSYEVRSPDGKPAGVLHFSFKVNNGGIDSTPSAPPAPEVNITGYTIQDFHHHPSRPQISYPPQTQSLYPSLEELEDNSNTHHHHHHQNYSTTPPQVQYPSLLESQGNTHHHSYPTPPPQVHYPSHLIPHDSPSLENYYPPPPPPPTLAYYRPPPPPPPPAGMAHGACYHHPPYPPVQQHPWPPGSGGHVHVRHESWNNLPSSGQSHTFGSQPDGYGASRDIHPAYWNHM